MRGLPTHGRKVFNIPPGTIGRISSDEVVAAMLAEDRGAATATEAPPKRGRGRPPTLHKHAWITNTIEAYIGAGLTRADAIEGRSRSGGSPRRPSTKFIGTTSFSRPKVGLCGNFSTTARRRKSTRRSSSSATPRSWSANTPERSRIFTPRLLR